ncbi:MAG: MarR family transcriptional regulator [Altererythrobacter sp.]|jgi:DNA-binding MarR family transcriptional regulator|uniref:MarR family winged helix-turn-helix transcriptional regulator n=1 Tax=Sphingobium sp. (strain YBL2) TaxID=484429 RepID=UPI0005CB9BE0|nr:MarR family transcriptional regulator [Sphingobium sp. YBL2]MBL8655779.1 MarR family transcriptional regulator [Altererythrobacter sp.]
MTGPDLQNVVNDNDRAIFLMDEISRAARRAFDERTQPIGLHRTQWRVLAQLIKDPSLNQSDVARQLELESATVGLAVSALCNQGYIIRRRDLSDGRAWQLELTKKVEDILPELRRAADATHEKLWAGVSPAQKRSLTDVLAIMSANARGLLSDA